MKFGERLSALLDEQDISISKMAADIGIGKSTIHHWITGGEPALSKALVIAEYLGVSVDYLASGSRETKADPDSVEVIQAEIKSKGLYEIRIIKKRE